MPQSPSMSALQPLHSSLRIRTPFPTPITYSWPTSITAPQTWKSCPKLQKHIPSSRQTSPLVYLIVASWCRQVSRGPERGRDLPFPGQHTASGALSSCATSTASHWILESFQPGQRKFPTVSAEVRAWAFWLPSPS
ncbi:hypothetical protein HJG60_008744 [Phyllostomus discolor]|uniref:Uncharacterized protein n=1 Tax=Phyllostomus discolor TaxID=89673 RepID=A0A833YYY3_9CHIR|nr:hypothetical protein HJG60_008744 [Phyllostomus discolor]